MKSNLAADGVIGPKDGPRKSCFDDLADRIENHAFRFDRDTRDGMSDVSLEPGPKDGSRRRCSERRREPSENHAFRSAQRSSWHGCSMDRLNNEPRPIKNAPTT